MTDVTQVPSVNLAALGASTGNASLWYRQNYSDEIPLSYRAGLTFQEVLENIRTWIPETLIPYLQITNAGFIESLDELQSAVDTALQNAVNALVNGSVALSDPVILTALQAISSQSRNWLDNRYALYSAPVPSGGDDTAAIQALVNAAAATNGVVQLQAGVYHMNITTPGGTVQPIITGRGKRTTVLAATSSKPVFKFVGTSGVMGRGGLRSMGLGPQSPTSGGTALMYAGCCGVASSDVTIDGGFDEGVVFHNELAGSFTEFCTFEGSIYTTKLPIHYKKTSGNESFHGSGIVGNTIVGLMSGQAGPAVSIDTGTFPYNAPLSLTVFLTTVGQSIVYNGSVNGNRSPGFYGNLRMENQGGANVSIGTGNNVIHYEGGVSLLDGPGFVLGNFYLVDKLQYLGTAVYPVYKPHTFVAALGSSPTKVSSTPNTLGGSHHLMSVHIRASGGVYDYAYLVLCRIDYGGITGSAQVLATTSTYQDGTHAWGAPTFSWNAGLYISNASFPNDGSVTAYVTVTPLGGAVNPNVLHQ